MRLRFPTVAFAYLCAGAACFGQLKNPAPPPQPLPRAEGERIARDLVANLLGQKPMESSTNRAKVTIRSADRKRRQIGVRFELICTPTNYSTVYETAGVTNGGGGMRLEIVHSDGRPNQYLVSDGAGGLPQPRVLSSDQLMTPFAGSDFWVADLGLEFLHWPQQRVLRKEMRGSVSCNVLESTNPQPAPGGYARVLSWIGANHPDETVVVHADAYDAAGKLLKQFAPKKLEKVNGAYQLESMEMYNDKTDSRTVIEFNPEH
jgi:hypothetical protein